nr:ricin B lectin domain-containing protein [Tanacetum cinerariifolium]
MLPSPSVSDNNQNTAEEECMDPMLVRVYAKEKIDFSLSILDGMVILAPVNPSDPLQVQLTDYNPDKVDKSVLWTLGKNLGDGYRAIRAVDNIHLNLDAYEGIPKLGGVHDGTHIVLWDWFGNDKQRWTIIAYYCLVRNLDVQEPHVQDTIMGADEECMDPMLVRVYAKEKIDFSLSILDVTGMEETTRGGRSSLT